MLSPAIRPSAKVVTLVNGTRKVSAGGRHAEPVTPTCAGQVTPGDHHVVAERGPLVIRRQVGRR